MSSSISAWSSITSHCPLGRRNTGLQILEVLLHLPYDSPLRLLPHLPLHCLQLRLIHLEALLLLLQLFSANGLLHLLGFNSASQVTDAGDKESLFHYRSSPCHKCDPYRVRQLSVTTPCPHQPVGTQ